MRIDLLENKTILVITGPESSGKTTLAKKLSTQYELPLVQEYAREYLDLNGPNYSFIDIQNIAITQIEKEHDVYQNNSIVISDTDIVTLEIWALEKYGTSLFIQDELANRKQYLLCVPDIPWEPDPLRENPVDRMRLFELYKAHLISLKLPFTILNKIDRKILSINLQH